MIVGLHGRLQAGKDSTYAEMNDQLRGLVFTERLSFADPLKDSAAALLKISRDELEWMKVDPSVSVSVRVPLGPAPDYRYRTIGLTGREYLQLYGTEAHRDIFGDNFWVDQAMAKAKRGNVPKIYVLTDVRFENEAIAIHERGGLVVHVVGPDGKAAGGHVSEAVLPDSMIDFELDNSLRNDQRERLRDEVSRLVDELVRPMVEAQTFWASWAS